MNLVWWFLLPIIYLLTWKVSWKAGTVAEIFLLSFMFLVPFVASWLNNDKEAQKRKKKLPLFYENMIETGVLLLVSIVPWILDTRANDAIFVKTVFVQIIVFAMTIVWFLKSAEEGKFKFARFPLVLPVFAFFLWCIVTFITSPFKYASLEELYRFVSYFLLFFVMVNNIKRRDQVFRIITTFMITAAITAIYGIFQHYGYDFVSWQSQARIPSSLGNPNFYSGYLCIVAPLAFGMFFASKSLFSRVCYAILCFVLLLTLFWSQTRGGMAAIPLGLLFIILLKIKRIGFKKFITNKKFVYTGAAAVIVIGVGIAYLFLSPGMRSVKDRLMTIPQFGISLLKESPKFVLLTKPYPDVVPVSWIDWGTSKELLEKNGIYHNTPMGTAGVRVTIWTGCWRMAMENPFTMVFGQGLGVMQQAFPPYRPPFYRLKTVSHNTRHAHSEYFELLAEQGWTGLIIFLWIIFVFFSRKRVFLVTPDRFKQNLLYGLIGAAFAHLFENVGSVNLRWTSAAPFFWLVLGMAVIVTWMPDEEPLKANTEKTKSKDRNKKQHIQNTLPPEKGICLSPELKSSVYICSAVLFIFLCLQVVNSFRADIHLRNGVLYRDIPQEWDRALSEYEKALRYEPTNIEVPYKMAYIYAQKKDWQKALEIYNGIVRLAPNYTQIHYNLGITYYNLGQLDKAIPEFEKTVRFDWSNSVAFFMEGVCYAAKRQWESALDSFEKAVVAKKNYVEWVEGGVGDASYPAAHLNKGNIYYRLNKIEDAVREYEIVLLMQPGNPDASQKLQWIKEGKSVKWD